MDASEGVLSTTKIRGREEEELELDGPPAKRLRLDEPTAEPSSEIPSVGNAVSDSLDVQAQNREVPVPVVPKYSTENLHPPSLALLLGRPRDSSTMEAASELDVGITEYVSKGAAPIEGIIKQRFTDFLVFEIDLKGEVVHIKDIGTPKENTGEGAPAPTEPAAVADGAQNVTVDVSLSNRSVGESVLELPSGLTGAESLPVSSTADPSSSLPDSQNQKGKDKPTYDWSDNIAQQLSVYLSAEPLAQLERLYKEGKNPPRVSDSGWAGRPNRGDANGPEDAEASQTAPDAEAAAAEMPDADGHEKGKRGKGRGGREGRGGRGGRDAGRDRARKSSRPADTRQVMSDPIASKEERGSLHKAIRELFGGQLETSTSEVKTQGEAPKIVIKWNHSRTPAAPRGKGIRDERRAQTHSQYIHFNMQKTNRDSHDALTYLSRMLKCSSKDLMIAGTKDKRGVTVQRVCLKRLGRTMQDVWRGVNAVGRRRSEQAAVANRGERGVRIADLRYARGHLDLGMLKGNEFFITLRNVKVDSPETIEHVLTSLKEKGFINYYGMQRFGTSFVPTHATGLALLHSDWEKAISLILMPRPGEDPQVEAARRAWLENKDAVQALILMPRRVVAERSILEHFRDHGSENHLSALGTIPRNLRMMFVHAYQSYVWNAMVSERIKRYGCDRPIVGDLVLERRKRIKEDVQASEVHQEERENAEDQVMDEPEEDEVDATGVADGAPASGRKVKVLTEADLPNYSIFDVVMPLPGHSITMPGGEFGQLYEAFLRADGLSVESFRKPQKEYSLGGAYRKVLHKPTNVSWTTVRYTDPNLPLAQSDEDKILGFDQPVIDSNGKFLALQIRFQLAPAAYATMALREITKTETSSQFQSNLTLVSEDQLYKDGMAPPENVGGNADEDLETGEAVPEATEGADIDETTLDFSTDT